MTKTVSFTTSALTVFAVCTGLLLSQSCSNISTASTVNTDSSTSSSNSATTATTPKTASYESSVSPNIIEIENETLSVTISGLPVGKEIYLAKTNPSSSTVASSYSRYVADASGMSLNKASSSSSGSGSHSTPPSAPGAHGGGPWHCFIPGDYELDFSLESARAATTSVTQIAGTVGESLDIYIDHNYASDLTAYYAEAATLRAVGTYCDVWIVDSYYSSTASGNKVNTAVAENVAAQFDAIYPMVRNIFGEESDYLLNSSGSAAYAMSSCSATGTKVNIVLYDIAADYSSSATSSTGIAGYFHTKDYYYSASSISNKGKYFYIDSAYANSDINDIYSTLAHEFQHMINFSVKKITQGLSSGSGYNEMLSMLCEDMMEVYFESTLNDFDEEASPMCRLPWFNALYYLSGLEYRSDSTSYTFCSYATNYAFGAWLLRNYGGIPLLATMSSNCYTDTSSIVAAVNSINASSLTMNDLLLQFAQACLFEGENSGLNQAVTALSATDSYFYSDSTLSYGYPLEAVDLWDLKTLLPDYYVTTSKSSNSSYYKYDGPELLHSNEYIEVRPYGILLHDLGTTTDSTVTITFSSATDSNLKMYLVID